MPSRLPGRANSTPTMIAFDYGAAQETSILTVSVRHGKVSTVEVKSTYLHGHDQGQRFRVLEQDLPWVPRLAQRVQSSLLQSGRLGIGDDLAILDMVQLFLLVVSLIFLDGLHRGDIVMGKGERFGRSESGVQRRGTRISIIAFSSFDRVIWTSTGETPRDDSTISRGRDVVSLYRTAHKRDRYEQLRSISPCSVAFSRNVRPNAASRAIQEDLGVFLRSITFHLVHLAVAASASPRSCIT
jgi:hypothetical protein